MAEGAWRDLIVGDRMQVDQQFADRVRQSGFSNQEWSLIMTAVTFEVEGSAGSATLVADTSRVPDIVPEMEKLNRQMGQFGGGTERTGGGGGFVSSLLSSLGLSNGGSADRETVQKAERLVGEYADALEAHLRDNGKWDRVVDLSGP